MKKNQSNYIFLFLVFALNIFFVFALNPNHYPDNNNLILKLITFNSELHLTPQNFLVVSYNFIRCNFLEIQECKFQSLLDLGRITFFIPTFLFIVFLFYLSNFFNRKSFNRAENKNFIFLSSFCVPSVILSVGSLSSEAIYTSISIFIILNINHFRKVNINFCILTVLLIYCFYLDKGNSLVIYCFLLGLFFILILRKYLSSFHFFITVLIVLLLTIFLSEIVFTFLGQFVAIDKISGLRSEISRLKLDDRDLIEISYRYLYFYLTLVTFLLPNKIFVFSFSLVFLIFILYHFMILKTHLNIQKIKILCKKKHQQAMFVWLFIFPFMVINLLPTHAYAKYYLFYIPILIAFLNKFLKIKKFYYIISFALFLSLNEYMIFHKNLV